MANSVASYQFTLDGNGNRISSTETQPAYSRPHPTASRPSTVQRAEEPAPFGREPVSYTYDYEGQLANAGGTGLDLRLQPPACRQSETDTQFSYDGRGNRLIATRAGVTTRYIYDPWGNLMAEADFKRDHPQIYLRQRPPGRGDIFRPRTATISTAPAARSPSPT